MRAAVLTRVMSSSASTETERVGDPVLVLEQQAVGLTGDALQRDARVEQRGDFAPIETIVGGDDRGHRRQRAQDGDVATATAPFLQVGLERVRDVAGCAVARLHQLVERGQALPRAVAPLARDAIDQLVAHRVVAGDDARVEQAERGLEVVVGDGARLVGRADAVVELEAGVPDRVPEPVGERADVATATPVVDQDEVEVAGRTELAAAVRTDGEQHDARLVAEEADEPLVDHVRRPPPRRRDRPGQGRRRARARRA